MEPGQKREPDHPLQAHSTQGLLSGCQELPGADSEMQQPYQIQGATGAVSLRRTLIGTPTLRDIARSGNRLRNPSTFGVP